MGLQIGLAFFIMFVDEILLLFILLLLRHGVNFADIFMLME